MAISTTLSILSERQQVVSGWNKTKLLQNEEDRIMRQWQGQTSVVAQDSSTIALAVSSDCQYLASSHLSQHKILIYRVTNYCAPYHSLTHHSRTPWCLTFSPSCSSVLLSGCLAGHVYCWNVRTGSLLSWWHFNLQCPITSISFLSHSSILVTVHNKLILMKNIDQQLIVHWETSSSHDTNKIRMALPHINGLLVAINNVEHNITLTTCSILLLPLQCDDDIPPSSLSNGSLVCASSRLSGPQSLAITDQLLICNYCTTAQRQCIGVFSMSLECLGELLYSTSLTDIIGDIPRHVCAVSYGLMQSHVIIGVGKYHQHHYHHVTNNDTPGQRYIQCLIMKLQYNDDGRPLLMKLSAVCSTHLTGSSCNTAIPFPVTAPITGVCIGTQAGHVIIWS